MTSDQRHKTMMAVKGKGSKIELKLMKALWSKGLRYRKNDKSVYGRPDITFKRYKIAIFVDSEFWHGKDWHIHKSDFKSNQDYWLKKIESNIERDKKVTEYLSQNGWRVVRLWGNDIERNLENCVKLIIDSINGKTI